MRYNVFYSSLVDLLLFYLTTSYADVREAIITIWKMAINYTKHYVSNENIDNNKPGK